MIPVAPNGTFVVPFLLIISIFTSYLENKMAAVKRGSGFFRLVFFCSAVFLVEIEASAERGSFPALIKRNKLRIDSRISGLSGRLIASFVNAPFSF